MEKSQERFVPLRTELLKCFKIVLLLFYYSQIISLNNPGIALVLHRLHLRFDPYSGICVDLSNRFSGKSCTLYLHVWCFGRRNLHHMFGEVPAITINLAASYFVFLSNKTC